MRNPIQAIREALNAGHHPSDIDSVVPIVLLRSYFQLGNWPGPYAFLRAPDLGLAWAVLKPEQTMTYVNSDQASSWEQDGIAWKERAEANLRLVSRESLWTHEKRDNDGRLVWAAMMHADGLGSSRLLLHAELMAALSGNYRVGLPDRSCAIVVPIGAGTTKVVEVAEMVRGMYERATTPMTRELLEPEALEIVPS